MAKEHVKRPLRIVKGERRRENVTVAQISDLHFTTATNANDEVWQALRLDLPEQHPDVLVVTGDLIDNSVWDWIRWGNSTAALAAARAYLLDLCGACGLDPADRLIVIPGNHDYRIKGNMISAGDTKLFRSVFANEFVHRLYIDLGVLILAFDSNPLKSTLELATGEIPVVDLLDITAIRSDLAEKPGRSDAKAWDGAVKVALLHHHPMPIAATEGVGSLTEIQSFLLLRNAARFMTQMIDERIDVVLHGHRHYPAFSRATYGAGKDEHTIAVAAAGSVNHNELYKRSYNVLRIAPDGEIEIERRSLESNRYEQDRTWVVRDYKQAREIRYERLLATSGGEVHAERYSRHDVIQEDSGDNVITEQFDGVTALSDDVSTVESRTSSQSGYYSHVKYMPEGAQQISWARKEQEPDGTRVAVSTFDPPIGKSPISFGRTAIFANASYFSQRDRLDASGQTSMEESVSSRTRHAYKTLALSATLPAEQFRGRFRLVVMREDGTPDYREQAFVAPHLTVMPAVHTVTFSMERPLPGYMYKIVWDLPPEADVKLGAKEAGDAAAVAEAFAASPTAVIRLLHQLVADFDDGVTVDLFIYKQGGQSLVASTGPDQSEPNAVAIRSGVGPVGLAYRRRAMIVMAPILYSRETLPADMADELNPFPPSSRTIVAVPLYYPLYSGTRVGTVVLRTDSNTSTLHHLADEQKWRVALHDRVQSWYVAAIAQVARVAPDLSSLPDVPAADLSRLIDETSISEIAVSCRIAQHKLLDGSLAAILAQL